MSRYRYAVLLGLGCLFALLVVMGTILFAQLRELQVSEGENMQWSISQLDTELASLDAAVSKELGATDPEQSDISLRLDIVLSRLAILRSGRAAELLAGNDEAQRLTRQLDEFSERAIAIADQDDELDPNEISALSDLVTQTRPVARRIALLGLRIQAQGSERLRSEFADQLRLTGGTAIALILSMGGLLLVLNQLLLRAAKRDAALLASSRRLQSTISASLDAIIATDSSGKILNYNEAAEEIFGWQQHEILGTQMADTIVPDHMRQAHADGMQRLNETGEARIVGRGRHEMTAIRKSGEEFPVELNITSAPEESGVRYIAYLRDITLRKINEQKLIDSRDQAERTDRAKSRFLAIMSHEMRTPLNGMLGVLDLLKTTALTDEQQRYANIATASSEILLEQVNEALDITRVEAGDLVLTMQEFDLDELIYGVADVLEPLATEKGLKITCRAKRIEGMRFVGDANRVRQVLTNLVGNAVKFTEIGNIKVSVRGTHGPSDSAVEIDVADTGPGIDEEFQEEIFEDYVAMARADGRQSRGDGLGLAISRRLARKMGGDLTLTSTVGTGTTFTLSLPLTRVEQKSGAKATKETERDRDASATEMNILVVEDHGINRNVLTEMLGGLGHHVSEAVDGLEATEQAEQTKFDAIFMDISMPRMDGIEATRRIRASFGPNAGTPIVGLTAHGKDEYQLQGMTAGMTSFQTKPVRLAGLKEILNTLDQPAAMASTNTDDRAAFDDLLHALGPEKLEASMHQFFAELDEFIDFAGPANSSNAKAEIGRQAHKLKGAAAMFGQVDIENSLQVISDHVETNVDRVTAEEIKTLEASSKAARVAFDERIAQVAERLT